LADISFVGSDALAKELGPAGAGVVITQVVPFPKTLQFRWSGATRLRSRRAPRTLSRASRSLEGHRSAARSSRALEKVNGEPTQESLIRAVQNPAPSISRFQACAIATPATAARSRVPHRDPAGRHSRQSIILKPGT
jgi:hypothetical protein